MRKTLAVLLSLIALAAGNPASAAGKIKMAVVGDIMIFPAMIQAARTGGSDNYDFGPNFEYVADLLDGYDLTIGNLETPLMPPPSPVFAAMESGRDAAETENGLADPAVPALARRTMPVFYSPHEVALALKQCGFDLLTTANNHALDKGAAGVNATIDAIRHAGIMQTGTYASEDDRSKIAVLEAGGLRVAVLAYSSGANLKQYKLDVKTRSYIMGWLGEERAIMRDIAAARKVSDYVVVCIHWGVERALSPQKSQQQLARRLLGFGADAVIGSHPHVLQPVEVVRAENGQRPGIIAYSMGNFISTMSHPCEYGMILVLELDKTDAGVEAEAFYIPVVTIFGDGLRRVFASGAHSDAVRRQHDSAAEFAGRIIGKAIGIYQVAQES